MDTSVLVTLHTYESATAAVVAWYARSGQTTFVTADWSMAEFASALALKSRTRQIDAQQSERAWNAFERQCAGELRLLSIDRQSFRMAALLVRRPTSRLRAADALHLAVAHRAGIDELATLDEAMRGEARSLRMRVSMMA